MLRRAVVALLALALLFGLVTWAALEAGGVAVVETRSPEGELRATHVWFIEPDGQLWLEAGTPSNPWFLDIQNDPTLRFSSDARSGQYVAEAVPGAAAREFIRSRLREKYGWRDWWAGLLVDSSGSVAVRLSALERQ